MSQSNIIFGSIFIAFIVFITMRGELPSYLQALIGTNAAPAKSGGSASGGSGSVAGAVTGAIMGAIGK